MGRPTKYFTREERLAARRVRTAERYDDDPSFVRARSNENRRYYAKKRMLENAKLTVPEPVQSEASQPFSFEDESIVVRFRALYNIECLENCAISDHILEVISRLPPYPPNDITLIDFKKDWEQLSAALYGYQIRKYLEAQQEQMRQYQTQTKVSVSMGLVRQFHQLHEFWGVLKKAVNRYLADGNIVSEHICRHNARWTACMMVYIKQDLDALAKNDDSYVTVIYNRTTYLGRLFDA